MRIATWLLMILVFSAGAAMATTSGEDTGEEATLVEPYSWIGDDPTNVALFMNQLPWGSNAMAEVLQMYGVSYDVYGSGSMGGIDLGPYDKVILASQQDDGFYYAVEANRTWFEEYMDTGGCMFMGCAAYFGGANEQIVWPGGFMHYIADGINGVTIVAPDHPVFNYPQTVNPGDLQNWNYSSHGSFNDLPAGALVTIENAQVIPGTPAAFDFCWGEGGGYVVAQPIDWVGSGHPYVQNVVMYDCGATPPSAVENATWGAVKSLYK